MSEETKTVAAEAPVEKKGVVVEFDFTVANGAEILYKTTEKVLGDNDIPFSPRVEAQHLSGGNYQGGLAEYFAIVKTKKTAPKVAKDIAEAFASAMTKAFAGAVTEDFKTFLRKLLDKGLKVVVSTRADMKVAQNVLAEFVGNENFVLSQETSMTYGSVKWDAWRRTTATSHLRSCMTLAVTGSGFGVKGALLAGMGVVAVMNDRVAWQDFGGVDEVLDKLDSQAADVIAHILRV